jgi:chemotaxis signal transduction protein
VLNHSESGGSKHYLTFTIARQDFAMDASRVRAILAIAELLPVPNLKSGAVGLTRVNGRAVAVFDLKRKLKFSQASRGRNAKIVVVECGAADLAGFLVDRISDVVVYRARDLRAGVFRGMGRPRRLLDPDILIGPEEVAGFWQTHSDWLQADVAGAVKQEHGPERFSAEEIPSTRAT